MNKSDLLMMLAKIRHKTRSDANRRALYLAEACITQYTPPSSPLFVTVHPVNVPLSKDEQIPAITSDGDPDFEYIQCPNCHIKGAAQVLNIKLAQAGQLGREAGFRCGSCCFVYERLIK
jgi:hypothetical protein